MPYRFPMPVPPRAVSARFTIHLSLFTFRNNHVEHNQANPHFSPQFQRQAQKNAKTQSSSQHINQPGLSIWSVTEAHLPAL
jgi:hypothetical protein